MPEDVAPAEAWLEVRNEAAGCRRCPLYKLGMQTVFGEGPQDAKLILVGEQPGDQEDIAGRPFVGPAGRVLDLALAEVGIKRSETYVTNAVKHFKHEMRGKRRIHQKPNAGEIDICKWWLDRELVLIPSKVIVALGATAARSLTGRPVKIEATRGKPMPYLPSRQLVVTIHPSMLLRLPDPADKKREMQRFVDDLDAVARMIAD